MERLGLRMYNRLRGSALHPQWLTDRFQRSIRPPLAALRNHTILDIGSGNSQRAALLHESNRVICLDYPATNQRYDLRPDLFGDARMLPIAGESIDAVFLFEVLEHVPTPQRVIEEIRRVLRPRGRLFLSTPFLYPIHDAPYDYQRFTVYGLRHILETSGFKPISILQNGNALLVPIQMLSLSLLMGCRAAWQKHPLLGLAALVAVYPLCLINNLIAVPLTWLPNRGPSCFGYFVVAERE